MKNDAEQTRAIVHRSLDEGITLFDTADIYGNRGASEEMLGKALPARRRFGVGIPPYFPLSSGFLTGKYRRGAAPPKGPRLSLIKRMADQTLTDENFATLERPAKFARDHNHTLLELAVGWLASQPQVSSVISGATSPEQVTENIKAGNWKLTSEELAEVDKLTRH